MFSTSTKSALSKFFFLCFLISVSYAVSAQVTQNGRAEIGISSSMESYSVVSLDTAGIILYRSFIGPKENQLELIRLDTALHNVWQGFLSMPKGLSLVSAKTTANRIYFFLEGKTTDKHIFQAFAVQIKDGSYLSYPIKNIIAFNAKDFVASKNALLIGGYFNFRPIVLFYSLKDHRSRILPGFLNEPGEITQINASDDGNIDVVVSAKNSSRKKCLWIRHFDEAGDLVKTVVLEPDEKKNLIFGRVAKASNGNQVIAGVYGKNSQYSRGIFVAEVNAYGEYVTRYYNFADLHNFFHYMKAAREKRVKKRIERRRIKGKKSKFNYRFLVHEIIPYGNEFVMVGEAFYPTYSSGYNSAYNSRVLGTTSTYGYPSRYYYNPYQSSLVFDGFRYTHAIVIGFDAHAKLTWDNSFEINGIKSYELEQFVKILPEKEKIALVYLYQNVIRSKIISNNEIQEGDIPNLLFPVDKQKPSKSKIESSKLEYWYGNHLFVYGTQEIKEGDDNIRKLFFINKLSTR
jgi:hypothetical protein